ncbi:gliding motility lipoprotein GldB [Psychroserpens sp.]|uniref:gliding motility lipoprotein GldB n=1 Tax=Psychroserpens sp. TaxID=2020870 RepID=UPI003C764E15
MKKALIVSLILFLFIRCKKEDAVAAQISKIETNVSVERFDRAFAKAKPNELGKLKTTFPYLFPNRIPDSAWIERMIDSNQLQLNTATNEKFGDFKSETNEIENLFQHLKYYDKTFSEPRVITLTNFVRYREKVVVTDTIVLIAIDNYLGEDYDLYAGIPKYIAQEMIPSQIVVDLAEAYSEKQIFQYRKKTFLDEMIYFGKQLYFKDVMIPFKSDAEKIGYTPQQLQFAKENEDMIWTQFVENEMLFSTESSLTARFIADAPFSKFQLELDAETPGRLGQYIGWQIVKAYMENNDIPFKDMLQKDAVEIFNESNYKPPK